MNYLSFEELRKKLGGRGRTTIYRDVERGDLPKPIKLGNRNFWIESQVDDAMLRKQDQAA